MKLDVPFFPQTTPLNCGPCALKMAFSYFGDGASLETIETIAGIRESKGISTIRLAITAKEFGFRARLFSKSIYFDEDNLKLDFYKKYGDTDLEASRKAVEEAKAKGVELIEKSLSLQEVLSYATPESIPIILLDWNVVMGRGKGYQGHFVPIVGYDKEYVYVHNHGRDHPIKCLKIRKEVFDMARKARGTDEDFLIISKSE